jgi:hypothetical protein
VHNRPTGRSASGLQSPGSTPTKKKKKKKKKKKGCSISVWNLTSRKELLHEYLMILKLVHTL